MEGQPKLFCGLTYRHVVYGIGVFSAIIAFAMLVLSAMQASTEEPKQVLKIIFTIVAIIAAVQLLLSLLLIYGAAAKRPNYILPWIIFTVVVIVLQIFGIINTFFIQLQHTYASVGDAIAEFSYRVFIIGITLVMVYFVQRYYRYLKQVNNQFMPVVYK